MQNVSIANTPTNALVSPLQESFTDTGLRRTRTRAPPTHPMRDLSAIDTRADAQVSALQETPTGTSPRMMRSLNVTHLPASAQDSASQETSANTNPRMMQNFNAKPNIDIVSNSREDINHAEMVSESI